MISVSVGVIAGFIMAKEAQARRHLTNKIGTLASSPALSSQRGAHGLFNTPFQHWLNYSLLSFPLLRLVQAKQPAY